MSDTTFRLAVTDEPSQRDLLAVDHGLDSHNQAVAPLAGVKPLACFASDGASAVVGGAVGRTWGRCCELQQLWVASPHQRRYLVAGFLRTQGFIRGADDLISLGDCEESGDATVRPSSRLLPRSHAITSRVTRRSSLRIVKSRSLASIRIGTWNRALRISGLASTTSVGRTATCR